MSNKIKLAQGEGQTYVVFHCPGCKDTHSLPVNGNSSPNWQWNGSLEKPTLSPSVLTRSGHYVPGQPDGSCWCTFNAEHPDEEAPFTCYLCHSFVRDGQIEFLGDCSHALAGQTVALDDIEANP